MRGNSRIFLNLFKVVTWVISRWALSNCFIQPDGPVDRLDALDLLRRHRAEQYLTCGQSLRHFFRQAKTRPQQAQCFVGN
jgi:hypothetical protein